jgi:mannose-1-phosphate guanylyltransferase/mannose-6-phosphate isomerase
MSSRDDDGPMIQPIILSGGSGTRLWPLSRALYPKQFLPLVSEATMLQETARRVADGARFLPPLVICNAEHRFIVAEQLREIGITPAAILLEPEGRNTAPAAAVAALMSQDSGREALALLLPSDHAIADLSGFAAACEMAAVAAQTGEIVTFGIPARSGETGYGYIKPGEPLADCPGCHRVARFVEKPEADAARAMAGDGGWLWNSGMFLFSPTDYLRELETYQPEIIPACRAAIDEGAKDLDFFRLAEKPFRAATSISIDYAVMQRTERAAVVPADIGWSDIGSWAALWDLGERDEDGNVIVGDVIAQAVHGSYLRSEGRLLAVVGVDDLLVVTTEDAILVAAKDQAQDVKPLVDQLKRQARSQHSAHVKVFRPWGSFQSLDVGDRFQVKQLAVKPGARLSLQSHEHRAEHWVVVSGTARVTRGEEVFLLESNQSTYIPAGTKHRLENPGAEMLRIIEIQSGDYLGEDDILRYDDVYGRR